MNHFALAICNSCCCHLTTRVCEALWLQELHPCSTAQGCPCRMLTLVVIFKSSDDPEFDKFRCEKFKTKFESSFAREKIFHTIVYLIIFYFIKPILELRK